MQARIGKVLYWAGLFMALAIVAMVVMEAPKREDYITGLIVAAAFAGAGWGARYVLAGK